MSSRRYIIWIVFILLILLLTYYIYSNVNPTMSLSIMNDNLEIEGIKFGMTETEVTSRWGSGEYIEGFGGYGLQYSDKETMISFSNDKDNDLYGRVSSIYFSNPKYSIFAVKIGDNKTEGILSLKRNRFKPEQFADDTFVRGEFSIALRGNQEIEYIQIWFNDKDLKDRNY